MSGGAAHGVAVRRGFAGGGAAAAVLLLPPCLGIESTALADYAATLAALLAVLAGARAGGGRDAAGFGAQLAVTALTAALASLCIGIADWVLYSRLRPTLLAARFAQAQAQAQGSQRALGALAAHASQSLDPAFQAFGAAVTTLFLALLLGAYLAWRARLAAILRGGRSSPRR